MKMNIHNILFEISLKNIKALMFFKLPISYFVVIMRFCAGARKMWELYKLSIHLVCLNVNQDLNVGLLITWMSERHSFENNEIFYNDTSTENVLALPSFFQIRM